VVPGLCLLQVAAPLVVARMTLSFASKSQSTTQPWVASGKATACRYACVPEVCSNQPPSGALQVAPPSVVARMTPPRPTAQPWVASLKATAWRNALVPEVCALQVAPPFVVARMAPELAVAAS